MTATAAQPDAGASPRLKRRPRWWVLLLILLALLVVMFAAYRLAVHYRVSSELATLRAAGYPTSMEELAAYIGPPPPAEENGAAAYAEAFAGLRSVPADDDEHVPLAGYTFTGELRDEEPLTDRQREAVDRYLQANAAVFEPLRRAGDFERTRFSDPFPTSLAALFETTAEPPRQEIRTSVVLLQLKAMVRAEEGESADAAQALGEAWRLADALGEEPFVLCHLAAGGIRS